MIKKVLATVLMVAVFVTASVVVVFGANGSHPPPVGDLPAPRSAPIEITYE